MKPRVFAVLAAVAGASLLAAAQTYTTRFEGDEDPWSEGGKWQNLGLDWTSVRESHGVAFGTQTGTNTGPRQYDDTYETGDPGIGLLLHTEGGRRLGSNTNFGFASFTAKGMAETNAPASTRVSIAGNRWLINNRRTNPGSAAEGLLMNVRMVNAVFEDRAKHPEFDPEANTRRFLARMADYAAHGVNAFTVCLQGGMPGYEGALNSAFEPDGSLRTTYLARVERVIRACDRQGLALILGLYYQRQSAILRDEAAVRAGVVNAARWVREQGFQNVVLEIANEYPHQGFVHACLRDPQGQAGLIRLAKATAPGLLVSASGYGDGRVHKEVAEVADFLLPHWNSTKVQQIPARITLLKEFGRPVVCNEDDKTGTNAVAALRASIENGAGYGLMLKERNQTFPFRFEGAADDPAFYAQLRTLTAPVKTAAAAEAWDGLPLPASK